MDNRETMTRRIGSERTPGFTLIEVVLVAVIMAMLLAASIPRFVQTAQRMRAEQQAFGVAQHLRLAHEVAVSDGSEIVWVWDPNARQARLLAIRLDAQGTPSNEWLEGHSTKSPRFEEGSGLTSSDAGESPLGCPIDVPPEAACIHFFPDGTSESSTLTMHLSQEAYTIAINGTTSQVLLQAGPAAR